MRLPILTPSTPLLLALVANVCLIGCSDGNAQAPAAAPVQKAAATQPPAAPPPAAARGATVTGTVAESINSGGYTYIRLKTSTDDVWIAASEIAVKTGERLTAPLEMPMQDFHSKTLNRDFPLLYFVSQVARDGQTLSTNQQAPAMMGSHERTSAPVAPVPPAPGGLSIADVWKKHDALAGKPVTIRGRVVKVNNGILGRNWIHLQDGSGTAADRTNDLTVTTSAEVTMGDIVTASGVLATKKDFGAGYAYDAILENARVTGK